MSFSKAMKILKHFSHLVSGESGCLQENIPHGPPEQEIKQRQLAVTSAPTPLKSEWDPDLMPT